MRKELCRKVYDRYLQRYDEINAEVEDSYCRFRDIAANLLSCKVLIGDKEGRKFFLERIRALRDYFWLLEQHPEFKRNELSKLEGHFPEFGAALSRPNFDFEKEGFSTYLTHYVAYAKKKLEND